MGLFLRPSFSYRTRKFSFHVHLEASRRSLDVLEQRQPGHQIGYMLYILEDCSLRQIDIQQRSASSRQQTCVNNLAEIRLYDCTLSMALRSLPKVQNTDSRKASTKTRLSVHHRQTTQCTYDHQYLYRQRSMRWSSENKTPPQEHRRSTTTLCSPWCGSWTGIHVERLTTKHVTDAAGSSRGNFC